MLERRHVTSLDGAHKAQVVARDNLIFLSGMQPDTTNSGIKEQIYLKTRHLERSVCFSC